MLMSVSVSHWVGEGKGAYRDATHLKTDPKKISLDCPSWVE